MNIIFRIAVASVLLAAFSQAQAALVEDPANYPSRSIKLISPFSPGGGTDTLARLLADGLTKTFGKTVVVENRPGADGAIGAQVVARAQADGYTLLIGNFGIFAVLPHLTKTPYDPIKDFTGVAQTTNTSTLLVVSPQLNVRNVKELIELARKHPGKLNYAASSSSPMVVTEMFKQMTGTDLLAIPYKGTAPAVNALIAGEVDVMFGGALNTMPFVKQGRIKGLATAGANRSLSAPDLPTVAEAGVPGFVAESWNGVMAPKGTPATIVRKLNLEINKIMQSPLVRNAMKNDGGVAVNTTPEQFDAFIRAEHQRWGAVVQSIKVKP